MIITKINVDVTLQFARENFGLLFSSVMGYSNLSTVRTSLICGCCSLEVNLCHFSFYLPWRVAERLDSPSAQH